MAHRTTFNHLPVEMIGEIFWKIPRISISPLFQVSRHWNKVVTSQIVTIKDRHDFRKACYASDICSILRITTPIKHKWINYGLLYACRRNNLVLCKWFVSKGATNLDRAFGTACKRGYIDLVQWIIATYGEHIKHDNIYSVRGHLFTACRFGHQDIAKLIIKNGIQVAFMLQGAYGSCDKNFMIGCALEGACWYGDRDFVDWILKKAPSNVNRVDFDRGLLGACAGGQMELVLFMINLGANNFEKSFLRSTAYGKFSITKLLTARVNLSLRDLNTALVNAIQGDNAWLVDFCINRGANAWNSCLEVACTSGNIKFVTLILSKGGDINNGLDAASRSGKIDIILMMLNKGANPNYGLRGACVAGNSELVGMLVERGANNFEDCLRICRENKSLEIVDILSERKKLR